MLTVEDFERAVARLPDDFLRVPAWAGAELSIVGMIDGGLVVQAMMKSGPIIATELAASEAGSLGGFSLGGLRWLPTHQATKIRSEMGEYPPRENDLLPEIGQMHDLLEELSRCSP